MELIKKLGKRLNKKGNSYELWGVFLCPIDSKEVERELRHGRKSFSCGCMKKILLSKAMTKHGGNKTKLYRLWSSIKNRCSNSKSKDYPNYGGRGITVCDEWTESYIIFRDWALSNDYKDNLQINRINNDGNYEPSNCNFITARENTRNRRGQKIKNMEQANEIRELYKTGNYTQKQIAKKYNLNYKYISSIINNERWV